MSFMDMTQKKSDGEVSEMLELWGMRSIPTLLTPEVHSDSESYHVIESNLWIK